MKINIELKTRNEILLRKGIERKIWMTKNDFLEHYLDFKWLGNEFKVYLRFKDDIWVGSLITPGKDWLDLNIPNFDENSGINDIKKVAIEEVIKILK